MAYKNPSSLCVLWCASWRTGDHREHRVKSLGVNSKRLLYYQIFLMKTPWGEYRPYLNTTAYGKLPFAADIFGVMSEASSQMVHHDTQLLLKDNYHQFQTPLPRDIHLDDTRGNTLKDLVDIGNELVKKNKPEIEQVCDTLVEVSERRSCSS